MQKFWWPGYEMQLLAALQRQQNSAQFCDTLLQTEGISVPTHSCVLAALSPYLSQRLSASPSPPSGQRHRLRLQAVKAQTLLKLVGLLYSGELEVKGSVEQDDVLAVARQFGIAVLLEGEKVGGAEEAELQEKRPRLGSCRENDFHAEESRGRDESRKMQGAQVQAEMAGRRDADSPAEKKSWISTGTQTFTCGENSVGSPVTLPSQSTPPTPESAAAAAQSLDFSAMLQPQSITLDKQFCSTSCQIVPSMLGGAPSDGESPHNRPSACVINSASAPALSSDMLTLPVSVNDDSDSPRPQDGGTYQQSSESGDGTQVLAELESGKRNGKMADNRGDAEQPSQANGEEMPGGEERGKSSEKRHAHASAGMKSLAKMKQMQQMIETTQISVKVKLRRRTKGEVWEVVNMQDPDQTLSVLTSLRQDGSNLKKPETDRSSVPPPPSTVQSNPIQKPDCHVLRPAATNSSKSPPHLNASSDSQPPPGDRFAPNQNDGLEAAPLPQYQGSVEECDEQIEKLLEDIMMGLNILPNCKKSHHPQLSHDGGPTTSQVPVTQNDAGQSQMHAAVGAAGCVFYQDLGTQSCNSSIGTGTDRFPAQNQPSCSSYSSVLPDAALVLHQQERSPQYQSSVRPMWQRDRISGQSAPLSKSQEYLHPEAPATRSVIPSAFFSAGQKLHYPACQELFSQDNQHIFEYVPRTTGNETPSIYTLSLSCLEDLRLPQCLSPLEPYASSTKHQPVRNNPTNPGSKVHRQPSLHGRPWLTEKPGSLQFALSAITHRENKSAPSPQDANCRCWSKQHLELNPQKRRTCAESGEPRQLNAAKPKSDPRNMRKGDTTADAVAPKRKKTKHASHLQDAAGSVLPHKEVRVSGGTKSPINLSICQVSLSRNNVLLKEREMATSSSNISSKMIGKPNQGSGVRGSGVKTDQTRIRTRGFLKKTQESTSDTSTKNPSAQKPVTRRAKTADKQGVMSHKRGKLPKTKVEELTPPNSNPTVVDRKSHSEESQQEMDNSLPKEDLEKGDTTKRRCKKRWLNRRTEVGVIPPKRSISVETQPEADITDKVPDIRKPVTPKRPQTVSLKEFQTLVKRRHSKIRKSRESQETDEAARDAESGVTASGDCPIEESTKETDVGGDVTQPGDRGGGDKSVAVDTNHNEILSESVDENNESQRGDTDSSACKETALFGGGGHLVSFFDALEEEVAKLAAEREQPLKNPDEAGTPSDTGAWDTAQQTAIDDEGFAHSDTRPPRENKPPSHPNLHLPGTPESAGPPLSGAGGIGRPSGCDQEDGEEVEVDVVLYSPVKAPQTAECEDGLSITERTPDEEEEEEEEEEDANEIDVTGD